MKMYQILCVISAALAPLTFTASATASAEDGGPSVAAVNVDEPAGRRAPDRNAVVNTGRRKGDSRSNQVGARAGGGSTGSSAAATSPSRGSIARQNGAAQAGRSNADRLRSLLTAQAHARLAGQRSRSAGSTRTVGHGQDVRGAWGMSRAGQSKLAGSNSVVAPAAKLAVIPRNAAIGGPHTLGPGRLGGGAAIGRAARGANIDGAQLRRKF